MTRTEQTMTETGNTDETMPIESMLDGLTTFIDRFVVPLETKHAEILEEPARLYGERGGYSDEVVDLLRQVRIASARAGYYNALAPREIGGEELGPGASYHAWERLHHRYGPARLLPYQTLAHWTNGPSLLVAAMTEVARKQVEEAIVSGDKTVCFAMSEPEAGSDAWSMRTTARRENDAWVLNGSKQWISNSPYADYAFVFAVTDGELRKRKKGGISCFFVPMDAPGFTIDRVIKLFGHGGGNESILALTEVRVPDEYLVGELHQGFALAMGGVSEGRMYNAGRCVGLARWALEQATEYAKARHTFGQPIASYQGVSFQLAECAIEIYAAKSMAEDCARLLDTGAPAVRELAMVKAYTTEMCFRVFDRCMQVLGGMGLTNETRFYDGWHQARTVRIADGSGEIMRKTIASRLLRGELAF